jgi:predicted DNA-binding transcriptional regulator AlpA
MKKQEKAQGQYISIPKAAEILGMSRIALYKQVKRGDVKSIKIGKTHGIKRSVLSEIGGGRVTPARKKQINRGVKKVIKEYGDLLTRLGKE